MIPAVRRRSLTSINSTELQWHFNNNRCHWCSFRSSGTVRMTTVRISRAPRFRRECIVCSCAVCIICSRASLPSLKIPPICTQLLIHRSKSLPARLRHRRSCVRRIVWRFRAKSPYISISAFCRASVTYTRNKNPTVVMIVGFSIPSALNPVGHPHCWNHRLINIHIGWSSFALEPMVATVQSVWCGFKTRV